MDGLSESHLVESVFPALDIIRRAGPPPSDTAEFKQAVLRHLSSDIWSIREMAARTASALLAKEIWTQILVDLEFPSAGGSTNQRHGALMALNFVLERRMARGVKMGAS